MSDKKKTKTKRARTWQRRLGAWWASGLIIAVVALFVVFFAYREIGGGSSNEFKPQIAETPAAASKGEPFQDGPRLYLPVEGIDMGHVPLGPKVSYAFALTNVGDAPLSIEDVQVKMLEGC